ncbi:MAG: hypothetical protein FWC10_08620 [Lentimicrobiaceae bacterium]|nr:hypothetical protein [Lentimicrobiaceae bacterium]
MKKIFVLFWLVVALYPTYAQFIHSHNVVIGSSQIKDKFNLGMVFSGVQMEYRCGLMWKIHDHEIQYQPKLGFGIGFNSKMIGDVKRFPSGKEKSHAMLSYEVKIAPINVNWIVSLPRNWPFKEESGHTIKVGLNFTMDYSYQAYLDLHGANMFWASEIGISPIIQYYYHWNNKKIGVRLQNSLLGFTSHTQKVDHYYYYFFALDASDWFKKPHENMRFGSFNNYNHTNISFEFVPNTNKKHSFLYELDYFGSYYETFARQILI